MTINPDNYWVLALALITACAIGWIICHSMKRSKEIRTIPEKVRNGSHEAANEATKLQYHLRQIANAPDPVRELMLRITRNR